MPLALRSSCRSSGKKSRLKTDISSVIQECLTALYFQKCWCESILIAKVIPGTRPSFRWVNQSAPLQRDPSFPGNKIVLSQEFRFRARFSACDLNHAVQNQRTHFLDGHFAREDAAGIDVNNVRHALREIRIAGYFQDWRDGIARRRAQSGCE